MLKDPTEFRERFAAWKAGEKVYEAGLPKYKKGTEGKRRYSRQQEATIDYTYNVLRDAGFDDMSISGILGNAMQESSLNPDAINKSGYSGLLQNSKAIRDSIVDVYGDHSLQQQLNYVIDWTNKHGNVTSKKHGKNLGTYAGRYRKSGYMSAAEAAKDFMKMYERPVILDSAGKVIGYQDEHNRLKYATDMYDYINQKYGGNKKTAIIKAIEDAPKYNPPKVRIPKGTQYPLHYDNTPPPASINAWSGADAPSQAIVIPRALPNITEAMGNVADMYKTYWQQQLEKPTM